MKKKITVFICIVISLVTMLFVAENTFSKYREKVEIDVSADIARWNILVNNESILNKTKLVNNIVPIFPETTHSAANVISPGSSGYFDIIINSNEVDVSFSYTINIATSLESAVVDLVATGYKINPTDNNNPISYNFLTGISGNVALSDTSTSIRIYIKWDDDSTATMDNVDDTAAASDPNNKAIMTATILFVQTQ
jgi:hypothetical protein